MEAGQAHDRYDAQSSAGGAVAAVLRWPAPMITISETIWTRMLHEFEGEPREVEQVAYIDGIVIEDAERTIAVATTLTIPDAVLEPGRFHVFPEAMSQAGKHFRRYRMQRLAQVHTHPSAWVGHSTWDDGRAYSQAVGAISIVLPDYARNKPTLEQAGVHLRTGNGWRQLSKEEIAKRLRVVPGYLDFRQHEQKPIINEQTSILPPRGKRWWRAIAFWRNKKA